MISRLGSIFEMKYLAGSMGPTKNDNERMSGECILCSYVMRTFLPPLNSHFVISFWFA